MPTRACSVCGSNSHEDSECLRPYQFTMELIDDLSFRWWNLDKDGNPIGEGEIDYFNIEEDHTSYNVCHCCKQRYPRRNLPSKYDDTYCIACSKENKENA